SGGCSASSRSSTGISSSGNALVSVKDSNMEPATGCVLSFFPGEVFPPCGFKTCFGFLAGFDFSLLLAGIRIPFRKRPCVRSSCDQYTCVILSDGRSLFHIL